MDASKQSVETPTPDTGLQEANLERRCKALLEGFDKIEGIIDQNRDARELDITVEEARSRKIVNGNETYIGRRVIDDNINRDKPPFIKYLSSSPRQIVLRTTDDTILNVDREHLEREFTNAFRVGSWFEDHMKVIDSMELHGRGVFLVTSAPGTPLGIAASYVAPEDFIFPIESRDIQTAPMLGFRYRLSVTQFEEWAKTRAWDPEKTRTILSTIQDDARMKAMLVVHQMVFKAPGGLFFVWYYRDTNILLTKAAPYFGGFLNPDRTPKMSGIYPVFPVYYRITENPRLVERKGRAHFDMHDQEALTVGWTSTINAAIRASEVYPYRADDVPVENPEVVQTDTILRPGVVTKTKLAFFSTPTPDPTILSILQSLRTENSSSAGQVDFAAQARKDSRKTATELDLASEQTGDLQAGPLASFAVGYGKLLQYMWDVVMNNLAAGVPLEFLSHPDDAELRAKLAMPAMDPSGMPTTAPAIKFVVVPAGDVDYIERQKKLQRFVQYLPLYQQTPLAQYFLQKILELAFPDEYQQMAPLLQDQSKNMGVALLHLLEQVPLDVIPPEQQDNFQQILAQAQQIFGSGPGQPQQPQPANDAAQVPNGPAA